MGKPTGDCVQIKQYGDGRLIGYIAPHGGGSQRRFAANDRSLYGKRVEYTPCTSGVMGNDWATGVTPV